MPISTADLCDQYADVLHVVEPIFASYGGVGTFGGPIATVRVYEDNMLVRATLEEAGAGRVLVVDGGGSLRRALFGDQLATLAHNNGWAGIVVYGCIRDARALAQMPIGVKALNTNPLRSNKRGVGERSIPVTFAGVTFQPDHYLYADEDGIVVSEQRLLDE
jgi:regulator of ribonuclease activity A